MYIYTAQLILPLIAITKDYLENQAFNSLEDLLSVLLTIL